MLAIPKLKSDLISYIMKKFQEFACSPQTVSIQVVLDYEGTYSPISISSKTSRRIYVTLFEESIKGGRLQSGVPLHNMYIPIISS